MWQRLSGFAVLLTVAVGVVTAPATRACACSCAVVTAAEAVARAELVFDGVVLTVDGAPNDGTGEPVKVRFAVDEVRKGPRTDRVEVSTATNSAACGFDFQPGQRYRVHATDGRTGLCSGNLLLGPAPSQPRGGGGPTVPGGDPASPGGDTGASGEPATGASPGQPAPQPPGGSPTAARPVAASSTAGTSTVLVAALLAGTALLGGVLLGWWTRSRRAQKSG